MTTQLDPETIEVWAGLRSIASRVSELQDEIDTLRGGLSGYTSYKDFLRSHSDFAGLEADLKDRASDSADVSDSDVAETVTLLEDNFTSYSDYVGDTSSGALAQDTYDQYRSYLTDNGIASIDADTHIQVLKTLFDPDDAFASATATHSSWDDLQSELESNGVTTTSAETTVTDLKSVFQTVGALDRAILAETSWSDVQSEFESRGLSSTEASDAVDDLKTAYGSTLNSTVKNNFSSFDSYSELQTYLENNGFSSSEAQTTIDKIKGQYASFAAFRTEVLSQDGGLAVLLSSMPQAPSTGGTKAGLKIFEQAGTALDGTSMPKDGATLRATKINFVEIGQTSSQTSSGSNVSYSNISLGESPIDTNETTRVTAEVTNNSSSATVSGLTVPLSVDGQVTERDQLQLLTPTQTIGVSFELDGDALGYGDHEIRIGSSSTVTLTVAPSQII